jgi:hypothetical protein
MGVITGPVTVQPFFPLQPGTLTGTLPPGFGTKFITFQSSLESRHAWELRLASISGFIRYDSPSLVCPSTLRSFVLVQSPFGQTTKNSPRPRNSPDSPLRRAVSTRFGTAAPPEANGPTPWSGHSSRNVVGATRGPRRAIHRPRRPPPSLRTPRPSTSRKRPRRSLSSVSSILPAGISSP